MNLCEYGANMRIRVGYVRYAKVILPQMRFRRANMVRMCENLGEHVRPDPEYACVSVALEVSYVGMPPPRAGLPNQ